MDLSKNIQMVLSGSALVSLTMKVTQPHYKLQYEWTQTIYGKGTEELRHYTPTPRGKPVRTTTYADANLMHDFLTGGQSMVILHFINQTPIQWFAKKQETAETATYGSKFLVARQATEQILDLLYTLHMMGIPIDGK